MRICRKERTWAAVGINVAWLSSVSPWGSQQKVLKGKFLNYFLRLKTRRDQGKKKGISRMSRFDREVKKLECSINYDGENRKKKVSDRRNGDRALCFK